MLTFSTVSRDLWGERMCPPVLNALSDGTLVAGMQKNFFTTLARSGSSRWLDFHHSRGSAASLMDGMDMYRVISLLSFCSGVIGPSVLLLSSCLPLVDLMCFRIPDKVFLPPLPSLFSGLAVAAATGGALSDCAALANKQSKLINLCRSSTFSHTECNSKCFTYRKETTKIQGGIYMFCKR